MIGLVGSRIDSASHSDIPDVELYDAIERVVDGIEPKLRYFPGYKKILKDSVATSLTYINHLVDTVPGPLSINSKTFITDPQVKRFFSTLENTQNIFSSSDELRNFFDAAENSMQNDAFALLCMEEAEKTVLGMELNDGILQREVLQTALVFSDHKILSPATNEHDVRKGIKQCIFDGLITHTLQQVLAIKQQINNLDKQKCKLTSRLKKRQSQGGGLSRLLASASDSTLTDIQSTESIKQKISENKKMRKTLPKSWDTTKYFLELIKSTLNQPENFISINKKYFNINKMGIICDDNSSQEAKCILFKEITIANVLKRVVTIVRYPRSDLLPKKTFNLK